MVTYFDVYYIICICCIEIYKIIFSSRVSNYITIILKFLFQCLPHWYFLFWLFQFQIQRWKTIVSWIFIRRGVRGVVLLIHVAITPRILRPVVVIPLVLIIILAWVYTSILTPLPVGKIVSVSSTAGVAERLAGSHLRVKIPSFSMPMTWSRL